MNFNETVLQIEADNISAIETSSCLDELRENIVLRKESFFFTVAMREEMKQLTELQKDEFKLITVSFHGNKTNHIYFPVYIPTLILFLFLSFYRRML